MNNFGVLYRYEWKKLLGKKIVWVSFALCMTAILITFLTPLLSYYEEGGKRADSYYQMDLRYYQALNGREINQELLEETIAAYRKIPKTAGNEYTSTEEYQQYARPYSAVFNFIVNAARMQKTDVIHSWQPDETELYEKRKAALSADWKTLRLSEGEIAFWQAREAQIKTPYVYQEHEVYDALLSSYYTIGILLLFLIGVCLSGMFSEDYSRKTDQIIFCSKLGKHQIYWSKMAAGFSFAVICALLFSLFAFFIAVCLYGFNGFSAAFQLLYTRNSEPISCGQAILIAYGNMLFTAAVIAVFVMFLSELLHNNMAVLAVFTAILLTDMFLNIPEQYRILAQIWSLLPWSFLSPWNVFSKYTIAVGGQYITAWQAAPVLYTSAAIVLLLLGKPIYQRFEVSGR